jgi:hypothetical protein
MALSIFVSIVAKRLAEASRAQVRSFGNRVECWLYFEQ